MENQKIKIIEVTQNNKNLLKKFISSIKNRFFRYYDSRNIDIIKNHKLTILALIENEAIGYGHIDFENKYWLGIYLDSRYRGKGLSKIIMTYLLSFFDNNYPSKILYLTVDHGNTIAFNLYKKYYFRVKNKEKKYKLMYYDRKKSN